MEELPNFNTRKLYSKPNLSDDEFMRWLQDLNLLYKTRNCECGSTMSYKWNKIHKYPHWRCTRKVCRKEKGFLKGTFFEGTHLNLKEVLSSQ